MKARRMVAAALAALTAGWGAGAAGQTVVEVPKPLKALVERDGRLFQPVRLTVRHAGAPVDATVSCPGAAPVALRLQPAAQPCELLVPAVAAATPLDVTVAAGGQMLATQRVTVTPVRKLTIYILPHSHTDIGYTDLQPAIEKKQVDNLLQGIAFARRTADYPPGARFVWNVEVLWAADLYLRRLDDAQRAEFMAAVKNGQVALNGMYLNELTGLCRPEELLQLFRCATELAARTGVPIDAAMISDVPGYTWGTVTAMAQAGIKYFSVAPNYFDRIGTILREWEGKPFYWVGPDGRSEVLVWIPYKGYAMSHGVKRLTPEFVADYIPRLERYPYDIAYMRWSGHGDNAVPEIEVAEFVKSWNAQYAWPKFIISGTSDAFRAFEQRYGRDLPRVRGDWTPYWEDGAGSSARETAMNRQSADRLSQAEALFALAPSGAYPAAAVEAAWKNVLLYSEHTWGAWCSVSGPERQETREQWAIKRSYAEEADRQSRELLDQALAAAGGGAAADGVDVWNSLAWPRSGLVRLVPELSRAGDRVLDERGKPVPSQRLVSGELAFLAADVPPLGVRRYRVTAGEPFCAGQAAAQGAVLDSGVVRVTVDEKTGGITGLWRKGTDENLADTSGGEALNDYRYFIGDNPAMAQGSGPVKITVGEKGPLVASLVIVSEAPGCKALWRELQVVAGGDRVELFNVVDKARLQAPNYKAREGKESLNFAFPFNVPGGRILLDIPLGAMQPERDQIPSACKNWFTVGRWADVSNPGGGVTWITLDAPLVQVGGLTANLLESQTNPDVWRKHVEPTQKLYSWAMNNHWGTNYRAYQEGPVLFRYVLQPHGAFDSAAATRLATGCSQPLLAMPARGAAPRARPLVQTDHPGVVVLTLKPSDDGRARIVRLFGASGQAAKVKLAWAEPPRAVFLSDTSERPLAPAPSRIPVPAWGVVTLRAE